MSETGPYKGEGETVYATKRGSREKEASNRSNWPDHTDPEWLYYQYHVLGKSTTQMGELVGKSGDTIIYHMEKHGIERRDRVEASKKSNCASKKLFDADWLRHEYVGKQRSSSDIANDLGVTAKGVLDALKREGIKPRSYSEAQEIVNEKRFSGEEYNNPRWLRHQYVKLGKSILQIAEEHGWSSATVGRALKRHGIPARSQTAAMLTRYKREKCPRDTNSRKLVSSSGIDASWRDLKDVERGCYIPYRDRKWLSRMVDRGLSLQDIADKCDSDVTYHTIRRWINRFGLSE